MAASLHAERHAETRKLFYESYTFCKDKPFPESYCSTEYPVYAPEYVYIKRIHSTGTTRFGGSFILTSGSKYLSFVKENEWSYFFQNFQGLCRTGHPSPV